MLLPENSRCKRGRRCARPSEPAGWLGMLVVSLFLWAVLFTPQCCPSALAGPKEPSARIPGARGADDARDAGRGVEAARPGKPENRAESVRALLAHLEIGKGSTVADVGAGRGRDTWVFAEVVGETGTVYAEEIVEGMVSSLKKEAEKQGLPQVRPVLGREDDPCLPRDTVELAFLRYVYHHLSKPREMLRGIWRGLKPGGYLVVVDQHRGTLRDWVPREQRKEKHSWIAETTVVREAREEGFAFVDCPEGWWHDERPFVLVFQRPRGVEAPGRDPDPFLPLSAEKASRAFLPLGRPYQRPVFVALGEARKLIGPILERSSGQGLEIVLEEWATQRDERPPLPAHVSFPSVLTDNGDPHFDAEPVDVVFFLDSYHLLFHGKTLLAKIHERLLPTGCVYVLDREAKKPLSRREASHRRRIDPETVKREMAAAGFSLWCEGPRPSPDRFLLVFGKAKPEELPPEQDPFVAGPEFPERPGQWLKENCWRLRGLKSVQGKVVAFAGHRQHLGVEAVPAGSPGVETWKIPSEGLLLLFGRDGEAYRLRDWQSLGVQR